MGQRDEKDAVTRSRKSKKRLPKVKLSNLICYVLDACRRYGSGEIYVRSE